MIAGALLASVMACTAPLSGMLPRLGGFEQMQHYEGSHTAALVDFWHGMSGDILRGAPDRVLALFKPGGRVVLVYLEGEFVCGVGTLRRSNVLDRALDRYLGEEL